MATKANNNGQVMEVYTPVKCAEVVTTDYNAKQFEAIAKYTPGVWVVFAQGSGKIAQHFTGTGIIPATAMEHDIFVALKKLKKYVDAKKSEEQLHKANNPDVKSRYKSGKMLELFVVTQDGHTLRPYNRDNSDWESVGFFQTTATIRNKEQKKLDCIKAVNTTLFLLGFSRSIKAQETQEVQKAKAEREAKAKQATKKSDPIPAGIIAPATGAKASQQA